MQNIPGRKGKLFPEREKTLQNSKIWEVYFFEALYFTIPNTILHSENRSMTPDPCKGER